MDSSKMEYNINNQNNAKKSDKLIKLYFIFKFDICRIYCIR